MAPDAFGGPLSARSFPSPFRPSKAWGVLGVGLLVTFGAFALARHFSRARAQARFEVGVEESLRRLEDRLRHGEDLIRGVRGLAGATPLSRSRYRAYLQALDLDTRFPGLLGVTYGVPVAPEGRAEVLGQLKREHPDQNPRIHPGWGAGPAAIVVFGEPGPLNQRALGFNTFAYPDQRASLDRAVDSGRLVASAPVSVAQAPEAGPGLVLRLAVYRSGADTGTPEARRQAWVGYANAVFLLKDLASGASERARVGGLNLSLVDHTEAGRPIPFFDGGVAAPAEGRQTWGSAPFASRRRIEVGGRTWELAFTSGPGFLQAGEVALPWMVGVAALVIAGLLATLVASIDRTGDRARVLAERMTERLRHSESRLRAITQVMPDVIFVLGEDGRYLEIHTGDPSRLVAPEAQLLGRTVQEMLPPEVAERVVASVRKALAGGRVESCEYTLQTQRGRLHFEARVAPMGPGAEGPPSVIWVARDVTERHIQEEAHRQAQRLESLGLLAGGIAHDFNNLLAAIQGYLSLQRMDLEAGKDPSRHLDRMEGSIQRAADLARQLLAYSGRGTFKVEPLDLNALVSDMAELLGVSRSKKVALEVSLAPDLPAVLGDRAQLQQVVMNLVTNANDAIGDQVGAIRLDTGRCTLGAEEVAHRFPGQEVAPGAFVTLRVEDDGCGIPPEVLARIFEPFFTTKPTGRGLGLAAIRGILRAHRAGVVIHSTVGKGTTFEVFLPVPPDPGSLAEEGKAGAAAPFQLEGTFLVADDEPALRETSRAMVEGFGLEVVEACDGEEAWELFQARAQGLRGALLDLTMPRRGGLEVYGQIRAVAPDFPILLVSGYSREAIPAPVAPGEPTAFLQKPFGLGELRSALQCLFKPG